MDLNEHYNCLFERSAKAIVEGCYTLDDQIDSAADNRYGITLLLRPEDKIRRKMQVFLDELKAIEPAQYYYPASDIHVTVLSIISCYGGFDLGQIEVQDYVETIKKSLKGVAGMEICFRGISASIAAVMIQGFPADENLNDLRSRLRLDFKESALQHSIDSRYSIFTAHATVARFRKPLHDEQKFVDLLQKYRQHDFGKCRVDNLELVYNDWYQRDKFVKKLHTFNLR